MAQVAATGDLCSSRIIFPPRDTAGHPPFSGEVYGMRCNAVHTRCPFVSRRGEYNCVVRNLTFIKRRQMSASREYLLAHDSRIGYDQFV